VTNERRGALYVAGAALLWSTGGLGIKAVDAAPLVVAGWRSAIAAAALGIVFRPPLRGLRLLAPAACYAACLTTFVVATKWTTAANAIFLQYSGVVWVLMLSPAVVGEPLRTRDAVAAGVALVGMALFFVGRLDLGAHAGDVVALISGIFFAAIVLLVRRADDEGRLALITWGNVLTAITLLPFVATAPLPRPTSLAVLLYLGVVQIAAAYVLFLKGVHHIPAIPTAIISMLEPIANPIWVFLTIGESPTAPAMAGAAIVLSAITWHTLSERPPRDGPR